MKKSFSKKRIAVLALSLLLVFSLCACSDNNALSSEMLVGTWVFTEESPGRMRLRSGGDMERFEIYRGGTAKGFRSDGVSFNFIWEIDENDNEVVNMTHIDYMYGWNQVDGFTLEEDEDGNLELHSVDGNIIFEKKQ